MSKSPAKSAPVAKVATVETAPAPKAKAIRYVKGPVPGNHVIRVLASGNPKRPTGKSYGRFALHRNGQTVDEYVKACTTAQDPRVNCKAALALSDVRWDVAHGFIEVVPPEGK